MNVNVYLDLETIFFFLIRRRLSSSAVISQYLIYAFEEKKRDEIKWLQKSEVLENYFFNRRPEMGSQQRIIS